MPAWLLTIKARQEGAAMDFTLRPVSGDGDALDVERAVLRADQEAVTGLLGRLHAEAERPRPRDVLGLVRQLGDTMAARMVPREILEALDEARAESCLLTIESNEATIPWELITLGGQPLCASFGVARRLLRSTPSRRSSSPTSTGPFSALVIADPESNLPWVDEEARELESLMRRRSGTVLEVLKNGAATAGAVMEALEHGTFSVVHFSCHTSHDTRDPGRSLIYLHDEPVPAARLFDARLSARPSLVFVNACQAGRSSVSPRGQHDGLAASFLNLGIQAFVGPLWPVSDHVSTRLSILFYKAVLAGCPVGEAMRRARVSCAGEIADDPLASWASYVVYGNPATVCAGGSSSLEEPSATPWPETPEHPPHAPHPAGSKAPPTRWPEPSPPRVPEERQFLPPRHHPPAETSSGSRFSFFSWLGKGTPAPLEPPTPDPDRTSVWSVRRWELQVVEGNDVGMRYELSQKVIRIGRSDRAVCQGEGLGIADQTVSREQIILTWDARRETYGVEHARNATNQTFLNDSPLKRRHFLAPGDRIRMGYTSLAFVPARPPQARPLPPAESDTTETSVKPPPPLAAAHASLPRRSGRDVSPPGPPCGPAVDIPDVDQTDAWLFRPSFHLAVLSGPDKGRTIALATSSSLEGRVIPIGRRGQRNNEITLNDAFMSNTQASLEFSRGRFWLNNDCGDPSLKINGSTVASRVPLDPGDTIHMGRTLLLFQKGEPKNAHREERFSLEVSSGPQQGQSFPLSGEATRIGRAPENEIVLQAKAVSHLHASIILRQGRHFIIHESRKNPTLVNGVEVNRERHLDHGDEIQVSGDTTLRFVDGEKEVFGP